MGKNLSWQDYQKQIDSLSSLDFNYDEKVYSLTKDKKGWHIDSYKINLSQEPPGEPLEQGSFAAAQNAIINYQFANPRLIQVYYDPNSPLVGRNLLMFAKFAGFRFTFGARITIVIDETKLNNHNQPIKAWGYAYRTLKGHFEIGEIRFEVTKNLITGEVLFNINAYSKADRIPNLFYRVGFYLFGRPLQKYFAYFALRRMQKIAYYA